MRTCGRIVRGVVGLLFKHNVMQGQKAPMMPREARTRPPDGSQVGFMRPQDARRSHPGDIREACALLAPRGGLSKARPKSRMVCFTLVLLFLSCRRNAGLQSSNPKPSNCLFYTGFYAYQGSRGAPESPNKTPIWLPDGQHVAPRCSQEQSK